MSDKTNQYEEIQEVINLPQLFKSVPADKISDVERKYYTDKERKREEMFSKMDVELKLVCDEIEKELKQTSEIVSSEVKYFNQSIKDRANYIKVNSLDEWEEIFQSEGKLKEEYDLILTSFLNDVSELEQKRADKEKQILATYRKQACNVLSMNPDEINSIFEKKILEINVMKLSNFQTYTDLQLQLKLLGKKSIKEYKQIINEMYKKWAEEERVKVQNEISLDESAIDISLSFSEEGCIIKSAFLETIKSLEKAVTDFGLNCNEDDEFMLFAAPNMWTKEMTYLCKQLEITLQKLDETLKHLLIISKKQIQYIKVNNVSEYEIGSHLQHAGLYFQELEQENLDINHIEVIWVALEKDFSQHLLRNNEYLTSIVKIREDHLKRVEECRETIRSSVAKVINCNKIKNQEQFIQINILLDALRQESTKEKLSKTFNDITNKLDDIKEGFGMSYNESVQIIEEIFVLMDLEVSIISAEIIQVQKQYSEVIDFEKNKCNRMNYPEQKQCKLNFQSEIFHQMQLCSSYVSAVNSWNFCLYEDLQQALSKVRAKLKGSADKWKTEEIQELVKTYDLNLQQHNFQYARIENEIKDVREAELDLHLQRMKSHCLGVHNALEDMLNKVKQSQSKINQMRKDREKKYEDQPSMFEYSSSYQVAKRIIELESEDKKHMETSITLIKEQEEDCEKLLTWLNRSNANYLNSVKLFSEGGNFNPDEVSVLTTELNKLNKEIDKQGALMKKNCEALTQSLNQTSSQSLLTRLQESLKELTLKETLADIVVRVQDKLKSEVFKMKCGSKKLENFVDLVKQQSENKKNAWTNLLKELNLRHAYLVIPEASSKIEWVLSQNEQLKTNPQSEITNILTPSSQKTKSKSKASSKVLKSEDTNITPENWRKKLFKFTDTEKLCNENNFLEVSKMHFVKALSQISKILQDNLVQKEQKTKSKKSVKSSKKLQSPSSYSVYMDEILKKLISYNEQCEKAWLLQVEEFFLQAIEIKKCCKGYIKKELDNIHKRCLADIEEIATNYEMKIKTHGDSTRMSRKLKDHLLLPLHGHPNNKTKLDILTQEAMTMYSMQLKEHDELFTLYKVDLQKQYNSYIDTLKFTENMISDIMKEIFSPDLLCLLMTQTADIINENLFKTEVTENLNPSSTLSSFFIDSTGQKKSLQLLEEKDSFKQWSALLNTIKAYIIMFCGAHKFDNHLSLQSSELLTPGNIHYTIAGNVKEMILKLENMYEEAQKENQYFKTLLNFWLNTWFFNVKEMKLNEPSREKHHLKKINIYFVYQSYLKRENRN